MYLNMKKIISFLLALVLFFPTYSFSYVSVKGYYNKNGTYTAPYVRSNPNGLKTDNYGYKPSQGMYNSSYGTRGPTWDTPTYITDPTYYQGKSIYDSSHSLSGSPVYTPPTYVAPTYTTPTYKAPTYDYSSLYNSIPVSQYSNYSASVVSAPYQPQVKTKVQMIVPYIVKFWADGNPKIPCNDSTFLNSLDIISCNDYRNNFDTYDWVAAGFKQTENYALYNNQFYSCVGKNKIVTATSTKPLCVSK
jgi:hypothetical protein